MIIVHADRARCGRIHYRRQPQIKSGNADGAVGGEGDFDAVIDVEPFGVVVHAFGGERAPGHEGEGGGEVVEPKAAGDSFLALDFAPAIERRKRLASHLLADADGHIDIGKAPEGRDMAKAWQVREARARFGAFLEASVKEGPQIVTKRGVETAVLLPIGQWRELRKSARPSLKEMLLAPEARTETLAPPRSRYDHRPPPAF